MPIPKGYKYEDGYEVPRYKVIMGRNVVFEGKPKEVAKYLGLSAPSIYYHIRMMKKNDMQGLKIRSGFNGKNAKYRIEESEEY